MARSQPRPVIIDRVLLTIVLGGVLPVGWGGANSDMSNPGLVDLRRGRRDAPAGAMAFLQVFLLIGRPATGFFYSEVPDVLWIN